MRRYIDAEKLCFEILEEYGISTGGDDVTEIYGMIINQPTADVRENIRGEWIDYSDEGYIECPFCHSATNCEGNKDELHYCFSCGAELR